MKAEYILNAIAAMKAIDDANPWQEPGFFGRLRANLTIARIQLESRSGLNDVEVPIEKAES